MSERAPGWPAELSDGQVLVRPLLLRDGAAWVEVRRRNVDWLRNWEATPPGAGPEVPTSPATFVTMTRRLRREARQGRGLPFAVLVDGVFVGQLNVGGVVRGSLHSAHLGYWIDQRAAGRGVMPTAVALVTDHCFWRGGVPRLRGKIPPGKTPNRRGGGELRVRG